MIIERLQQPTTERVEVCDWCGKDVKDTKFITRPSEWLGPNNISVHTQTCLAAFRAKARDINGLKPLGGDDADPRCTHEDCRHPRSWHHNEAT